MPLRAETRIVGTEVYKPAFLSRFAGFRCPTCGNLLSAWAASKTMRPQNAIDALRCEICQSHLVVKFWYGMGHASFFAVTAPVFVASLAIIDPLLGKAGLRAMFISLSEPEVARTAATALTLLCAAALTLVLRIIVLGRMSRVDVDNEWASQ